jgi:Fe-S-cluster-containing hydrogenase component 2
VSNTYDPLKSLLQGHWFKLICGASFQDLPTIRSLAIAYALAGADCIDVAADPAVIRAVKDALVVAQELGIKRDDRLSLPWLMVSINDGEDPHFRKAEFDPNLCPADCPRPCESICPAQAIDATGVVDRRCYGCGRCLPICPSQLIFTRSYVSSPSAVANLLCPLEIDAIEIHTSVGHYHDFKRLWAAIAPQVNRLKLLAISCPDDPDVIEYLQSLYYLINPLPCALLWQTDGRPMSGDIGAGTTHAAVKMAEKVLASNLKGYVQLAGGTNAYTVPKLKTEGKIAPTSQPHVAGIAYGSYARSLLMPIIDRLENTAENHENNQLQQIENYPEILDRAVKKAVELVSQLKPFLSN